MRVRYERPVNEFVMTFVGPVSRLRGAFVRPHDVELTIQPNGATERATIERVVHLGFEVRVELRLDDGHRLLAQATRAQADDLDLHDGQTVFVRPSRTRTFRRQEPSSASNAATASSP